MSSKWTADRIPDQSGRVAVVTGANSGIGLIAARELAKHGARVILACRNTEKGHAAAAEIAAAAPAGADVEVHTLDLGDLESVKSFASAIEDKRLDLLINNAGIMMPPRQTTADGFELQFGTNHLGHFALTGLLLERLAAADAARVVTLSSIEHKGGKLDFDDLQGERDYSPRSAYQQSKLANAAFGIELDRRLHAAAADSTVISVLAHPGYSATNLQSTGPTGPAKAVMRVSNRLVAQSPERGALPTLYAATAPDVEGGAYYGPDGFQELRGHPTRVEAIPAAHDAELGRRLWEVSEQLTGVSYALPAPVA
jgi:NAD(P)-dependent dehydrogenase (short-subunit alcohol dehydrogenase family)